MFSLCRLMLVSSVLVFPACQPPPETPENTEMAFSEPTDLPGSFDCVRQSGGLLLSAHRGRIALQNSENALSSFEAAVAQTIRILEVDVRPTKDGVLVLHHDEDLDRTTTGHGRVVDHTYAEISRERLIDPGGQILEEAVPTLAAALNWADGRAILELDIKRNTNFEDVVAAVRQAGAENRVVLITYSVAAAARLQKLAPEMVITTNVGSPDDFAALEQAEIDTSKILAFTGTGTVSEALNAMLSASDIEVKYGAMETEREAGGNAQSARAFYEALMAQGINIVATDQAGLAARNLAADEVATNCFARENKQ